jgi:hypothetical protein
MIHLGQFSDWMNPRAVLRKTSLPSSTLYLNKLETRNYLKNLIYSEITKLTLADNSNENEDAEMILHSCSACSREFKGLRRKWKRGILHVNCISCSKLTGWDGEMGA